MLSLSEQSKLNRLERVISGLDYGRNEFLIDALWDLERLAKNRLEIQAKLRRVRLEAERLDRESKSLAQRDFTAPKSPPAEKELLTLMDHMMEAVDDHHGDLSPRCRQVTEKAADVRHHYGQRLARSNAVPPGEAEWRQLCAAARAQAAEVTGIMAEQAARKRQEASGIQQRLNGLDANISHKLSRLEKKHPGVLGKL